jgi:hypothetical protein
MRLNSEDSGTDLLHQHPLPMQCPSGWRTSRVERVVLACISRTLALSGSAAVFAEEDVCQQIRPGAPPVVNIKVPDGCVIVRRSRALRDTDDEERIVTVMATGMIQVLRDNPALMIWLKETLERSRD